MNRVISSIDAYLSNMVDHDNHSKDPADEEEALVLRDLCMILRDSDKYEDGLFYDDTGVAYHLSCKCNLHTHQTCIEIISNVNLIAHNAKNHWKKPRS